VSASDQRLEVCRPGIIDETIDGEVVAINLDSGIYYSFRGVAAAVWAGVNGQATAREIAAAIEAGPGALDDGAGVVAGFMEQLVNEGLARPSDAAAATEWTIDGLVVELVPPVLEKFSDLEDLLLLDPIHDVDAEGWPHITQGS
jgi:hypothetical protein